MATMLKFKIFLLDLYYSPFKSCVFSLLVHLLIGFFSCLIFGLHSTTQLFAYPFFFTTAPFTRAEKLNYPRCPPIDEWIRKYRIYA